MAVRKARELRLRRHNRVRRKVEGTTARPRLSVFRSSAHIYAQIIDDVTQRTLLAASTKSAGVTPAPRQKKPVLLAKPLRRWPSRLALRRLCLTAVALSITVVSKRWPMVPARVASSFRA